MKYAERRGKETGSPKTIQSTDKTSGAFGYREWRRGKVVCGVLFLMLLAVSIAVSLIQDKRTYTNYALYSEQIHDVAWNAIGVTKERDAAISPNGEKTAETVTSFSPDGYISQWFSSLAPGVYDFSVFLRSDEDVDLSLFIITTDGSLTLMDRQDVSVSSEWRRYNVKSRYFEGEALSVQVGGAQTLQTEEKTHVWGAQLTRLHNSGAETPPLVHTTSSPVSVTEVRWALGESKLLLWSFIVFLATPAAMLAYFFFADSKRQAAGRFVARYLPETIKDLLFYPASAGSNFSTASLGASFFVSWVLFAQLTLTTPLAVFISQPETYAINLAQLVLLGINLAAALSAVITIALALLPAALFKTAIKALACISVLLAAEQLLLADIRPFGALTGQPIAWEEYAFIAKIDAAILIAMLAAVAFFLWKKNVRHAFYLSSVILFFAAAPAIVFAISNAGTILKHQQETLKDQEYAPFFEFSDSENIFYYQPDSVSTDVVKKIFEEHPDLASEFEGFTFFADNLGAYNGTLVSTYSVFTGQNANISDDGYSEKEFVDAGESLGFQRILEEAGYQTEFVPVYDAHCLGAPRLCVELHLRDLTPKTLGSQKSNRKFTDLLLLLDVGLFRHAPQVFKKYIYRNGDWVLRSFFLSRQGPGNSPSIEGVGPVLKEISDDLKVVKGAPRFKWYAGLGAHQPEQYDENCVRLPKRVFSVDAGVNQTICVLREYAAFLKELKAAGIYDKTALILNADTGSGNLAFDLSYPENAAHIGNREGIEPNLNHISMARPVLLVKPMGARGAMKISQAQTHQINMPGTILDLVGISSSYDAPSVFDIAEDEIITRKFFRIHFPIRYANSQMDFDEYDVVGPANNWDNYKMVGWSRRDGSKIPPPAPTASTQQ